VDPGTEVAATAADAGADHEVAGRQPLTRERIVAAALELIGREGLAACNMRRLATELGVAPMSIYYHVPSKSDLLDAAADLALSGVRWPDESAPWEEAVRQLAWELRRAERRYPDLLTQFLDVTRPTVGLLTERALLVCERGGFSGEQAREVLGTLLRYVVGAVLEDFQELRQHGFTGGTLSVPEDEWLASEAGERLEASFDFGLSVLLSGFATVRSGS
jgi:AcrR family transcriptional regulator